MGILAIRKSLGADVQFLTSKFFFAILPLIALGYILGAFVGAASHGWHVTPGILLFSFQLLALERSRKGRGKAIQSAIIGILFKNAEKGRELAGLDLHLDFSLSSAFELSGGTLRFNSERVKALTSEELTDALLEIAAQDLRPSGSENMLA